MTDKNPGLAEVVMASELRKPNSATVPPCPSPDYRAVALISRFLDHSTHTQKDLAICAGLNPPDISKAFSLVRTNVRPDLPEATRSRLLDACEELFGDDLTRPLKYLWPEESKRRQKLIRIMCPSIMPSAPVLLADRLGLFGSDPLSAFKISVDCDRPGAASVATGMDVLESVANGSADFGVAALPTVDRAYASIVPIMYLHNVGFPRLCVSNEALQDLQPKSFKELFGRPNWQIFHSGSHTLKRFVKVLAREIGDGAFCLAAENYQRLDVGAWPEMKVSEEQRPAHKQYSMVVDWAPQTFEIVRSNLPYRELLRITRTRKGVGTEKAGCTYAREGDSDRLGRDDKPVFARSMSSSDDIYDVCSRFQVSFVLFGRPGERTKNRSLVSAIFSGVARACQKLRDETYGPVLEALCQELWRMCQVSESSRQGDYGQRFSEVSEETRNAFRTYVLEECALTLPYVSYHPEYVDLMLVSS